MLKSYFKFEATSNVKLRILLVLSKLWENGDEELSQNLPYFKTKPKCAVRTIQALNTAGEEMNIAIATNDLKDLSLRKKVKAS